MFLQSPQSTCTIIVTKLDKGEANPMTSFCCSYDASTICEPFEISCFYLGEVKTVFFWVKIQVPLHLSQKS